MFLYILYLYLEYLYLSNKSNFLQFVFLVKLKLSVLF